MEVLRSFWHGLKYEGFVIWPPLSQIIKHLVYDKKKKERKENQGGGEHKLKDKKLSEMGQYSWHKTAH